MDLVYLDKACEATCFAVFITNLAGWISVLAKSWGDGWEGNLYPSLWICMLGGVVAAQAYYTYKKPQLSTAAPYRYWLWLRYAAHMSACAVFLVVCYAVVPQPSLHSISPAGWWAVSWLPPLALMAVYISLHRQRGSTAAAGPAAIKHTADKATAAEGAAFEATQAAAEAGEAQSQKVPAAGVSTVHVATDAGDSNSSHKFLSKCQRHLQLAEGYLGWSSMFWGVFLSALLVIQAAWQAADYSKHAPSMYGHVQAVQVPIDNTNYVANMFMRCVGPAAAGQGTFVLEADRASPGATLFGLQDQLAAAGRRSCAYDRLGLGWSDDIITPGHLKRIPFTLKSLLLAADVAPPYIMVGHGWGGQLALQYATLYPEQVAGLALLDSFSDAAAYLEAGVLANDTDAWGNTHYKFVRNAPQRELLRLSFMRAVAPFAWPRLASRQQSQYEYMGLVNALRGSNKHFQGQWGEYAAAVEALPDSLDEQLLLAAPNGSSFWYGYGWQDFSPRPVLVMPAESSVAAAGCNITLPACQESLLSVDNHYDPKLYFAKLALVYAATLSNNGSLVVVPGEHSFWEHPAAAAAMLVQRFAGV